MNHSILITITVLSYVLIGSGIIGYYHGASSERDPGTAYIGLLVLLWPIAFIYGVFRAYGQGTVRQIHAQDAKRIDNEVKRKKQEAAAKKYVAQNHLDDKDKS